MTRRRVDLRERPPYTVLSCSMSLDGYLDDATEERLLLSNGADFHRVDAVRAQCDAILVGARTVRRDDPRPLVRSRACRAERTARGVGRLMVEGGGTVHTQFLTPGLADELQLAVAPLFVGDSQAPRFVGDGRFPCGPDRPARLAEVHRMGDVVLLRYALSDRFGTGPAAA